MINIVTGSELKFENGEESVDMCKAIYDMVESGRREGREEGRIEGREEGREEGRAEGRAEGREMGIKEERLEHARRMKARHYPIEDICDITGLKPEVIEKL